MIYIRFVLFLSLMVVQTTPISGQVFQTLYGTNAVNSFSKVIEQGTDYYLLGSQELTPGGLRRATVTKIDATGNWVWTTGLNIPSQWNDIIIEPISGELLVVGHTLPYNSSNESLIGRIDHNGGFAWVRSYDESGQETYNRIRYNPNSNSPLYPFYILGKETDIVNGSNDVVVLNLDENGNFWIKSLIATVVDDEIANDLEVLPGGDMIISGENPGIWGVVLRLDNTGAVVNGLTPSGELLTYTDLFVQPVTGYVYTIANSTVNSNTYVFKFDNDLVFPFWEYELIGLTSVHQIWSSTQTDFYVTGIGVFNGMSRTVLMRFQDLGSSISLQWLKFLDNGEVAYEEGYSARLSSNRIGVVDGRTPGSGGLGLMDAFMSASDMDITTCMTQQNSVAANPIAFSYNGPVFPIPAYDSLPTGIEELRSMLAWSEVDLCASAPCVAAFSFTLSGNCGSVQFTDLSTTGSSIVQYCWDFDGNLSTCEASTPNPLWQSHPCIGVNACLIITSADGCKDTICQSVYTPDIIPPVITCPPDVIIPCVTSTLSTGNATAIDNCTLSPTITHSDVIIPGSPCNRFIHRTFTATDVCGNMSTCIQIITEIDNIPPQLFICPPNITLNFPGPAPCSQQVFITSPIATDQCDPNVTLTNSHNGTSDASDIYQNGTTTVIFTATDDCGNTSTCSFTVTVNCDSTPPLDCGMAVVTSFSQIEPTILDGYVISLIDVRNVTGFPLLQNLSYPIYHHPDWKRSIMGEVFGIAIDKFKNIYATATKVYTGSINPTAVGAGGNAGIYQINAVTGSVSPFVSTHPNPAANTIGLNLIPNDAVAGPGLGNICYDETHNLLFVTNFEDGKIYQIAAPGHATVAAGIVINTFDPFIIDDGSAGPACEGERIFGIGIYNNRLYFGRWLEHLGSSTASPNEIHSLSLDALTGNFIGTSNLEIILPSFNYFSAGLITSPVSDIEFSRNGKMLITERGFWEDSTSIACEFEPYSGIARVLEYTGTPGNWGSPKQFYIGNNNNHTNAGGGVDYGYNYYDPLTNTVDGCDNLVWSTGDDLIDQVNPVFGLSAMSSLGNAPAVGSNYTPLSSWYSDLDGETTTVDWNALGDLDIIKCACQDSLCDPCNDTHVLVSVEDSCCYTIHLQYNCNDPLYTKIEFDLLTSGFQFGSNSWLPSWNLCGIPTFTKVCLQPPATFIPSGQINNLFDFCLTKTNPLAPSTQLIKVTLWTTNNNGADSVACDTTLMLSCSLPCDTCNCNGFANVEIYYPNTPGGWQIPVTCDSIGVDTLPCVPPGGSYHFRGKFLCTDPANGTIEYSIFSQTLNTTIHNGTIQSFPIGSNVHQFDLITGFSLIPGSYNLMLKGRCGTDSCLCVIELFVPDCDPLCPDNLIPNPQFESYFACPFSLALINYSTFWTQPTIGTPDFFHACSAPLNLIHVPNNVMGYQVPKSGAGYAGFVIDDLSNYSEYIETPLSSSLVPGKTYKISFYVSLADNSKFAFDKIGAYLSDVPVGPISTIGPLPFIPQVSNASGNFITDKLGWTLITGTFTAPASPIYSHLVIGHFGTGTLLPQNGIFDNAYYYIDDVSICELCMPPCDTCSCGSLVWADVYGISNVSQGIVCNNTSIEIGCDTYSSSFAMHGDFNCVPDSCGTDSVFWILDKPGSLPDLSGVSSSSYPHFDIGIPWNDFQQPGNYTVTISRYCGLKLCTCVFNFHVKACPCNCPKLGKDVRRGFEVSGNKLSCTRKLKPKKLCPNDMVTWSVSGPGLNNPNYGSTIGNGPISITFPSPGGTYTVCMLVKRIDSFTGDTCTAQYCQKIIVKCKRMPNEKNPTITPCPGGDRLLNGDFTEGLMAGHLGKGGAVMDWSLFPNDGDGIVFVEDSTGASDDGHIVLVGGMDNFAGIFQQVNLTGDSAFIGFYAINYLGSDSPAGTALEFRLQSEPIQGPGQVIWRYMMDTSFISWVETSVAIPIDIDPSLYYLVICVQNEDETIQSVVGIDNIEICTDDIVGIASPEQKRNLNIYPNPNNGQFTVELPEPVINGTLMRIIGLGGQLLSEIKIENQNYLQTLEVTDLPGGMYFLQVISENQILSFSKFVKM